LKFFVPLSITKSLIFVSIAIIELKGQNFWFILFLFCFDFI